MKNKLEKLNKNIENKKKIRLKIKKHNMKLKWQF